MKKNREIFFEKAQRACKRSTAAMLCIILALATTSCVKQRNCDCGETGKFVYLKEPYEEISTGCSKKGKIVAHFFREKNPLYPIQLSGYVPIKYRSTDTVDVWICYENPCNFFIHAEGPDYYELKCIERR
jgi:hypothetical protein